MLWKILINTSDKKYFSEIVKFLIQNKNWPFQEKLKKNAEKIMGLDASSQDAKYWFSIYNPSTAVGNGLYAKLLLESGQINKASLLIKKIWINGNFLKTNERIFYKKFRKFLTYGDHLKRLDRLLWEGKYWATRRMLPKVKNNWKALAEARYSLRKGGGNVDTLIKKVPKSLRNHAGLNYERLSWRRRKGLDSAADLLKFSQKEMQLPKKWWLERLHIGRKALNRGRIKEALSYFSEHGLQNGLYFANAEWILGWINLHFLKNNEAASFHFKNMYSSVKYPISRARGAYWIARAASGRANKLMIKSWLLKASKHQTTYYGQLAMAMIGSDARINFDQVFLPSVSDKLKFNGHELVEIVKFLVQYNQEKQISPFIKRLFLLNQKPIWKYLTAKLATDANRPDLAIWVSKRASRDGVYLIDAGYPIIKIPRLKTFGNISKLEKALVLAVIRQESEFKQKAISSASSRGLMQLLPSTAKNLAKELKVSYSRKKLNENPEYNLLLGQAYLSKILTKYNNSYILALAAYNAGPKQVKRWIKKFGDPRNKEIDAIDWVEKVPFYETRNYIQRVIENLQVYRYLLLGKGYPLGIEKDLHIGPVDIKSN